MRIVILGATGGTGIELVRRSLAAGHSVTAFVRKPEALLEFRDQIRIRTGDPLDRAALTHGLRDHDAVLSGFGPRVPIANRDAHLLRDFATALTGAMHDSGVRRAIIIPRRFSSRIPLFPQRICWEGSFSRRW
jgi:putative NADH-flavin reductase